MTDDDHATPDPGPDHPVDLLIEAEWVVTMDPQRRVLHQGAVAVAGTRIVAVGPRDELVARHRGAKRIGGQGKVVIPGLVNAHQHLTGDRLGRSTIPDTITSQEAIFEWAVPMHLAHSADDDERSARLALLDAASHGITFTVEAGTVGHPERVLAGYDAVGVGGTLGSWGSDTEGLPFAGDVEHVLSRQRRVLELTTDHDRVHGWVTLVGHDLMSDELVVAASELARESGTGITFHLSPHDGDAESYLARTGVRPVVHLDRLGVLGPHVLLAHAVHLDDEELDILVGRDVAIAYCPWAYLRLGQGVTRAGRHSEFVDRGGRLGLGCDAENAGDAVDVLSAAALAAGLARDMRAVTDRFGAHDALEWATLGGARALGLGHEIGSLEVGKRADLAVIDVTGPSWQPPAADPVLGLVWNQGGRYVDTTVASGRVVWSRATT
jgi:5-methylthioadenosine/S-adenosylhomocysteine deaminase